MHKDNIQTVIIFKRCSYVITMSFSFKRASPKSKLLLVVPQLQCASGKPHKQQKTYVGKESVCTNLHFVAKSFASFPKATGVSCQFVSGCPRIAS